MGGEDREKKERDEIRIQWLALACCAFVVVFSFL